MPGIGIDFGTAFTVAAAWLGDEVKIINNDGDRKIPSLISFEGSGRYIGESATTRLTSNPENTFFGIKTLLGQKKPHEERWIPFEVVPFKNSCRISVKYKGKTESLPPEELSAMLISDITKTAGDDLGENVKCAAISVPVNFTNSQRKALKNACTIAGLQVVRLLNESTAASIAYGYNKVKRKRNIMVVNLGSSHLDVTVVAIDNNRFCVKWTLGNEQLGGMNFTEAMFDHFITKFQTDHPCNVKRLLRNEALAQLRTQCEKTKKTLSHMTESQKRNPESIFIPSFIPGKDLIGEITREEFEKLNKSTIQDIIDVVRKAKTETKEKIQEVVLVGGSTRIPKIRRRLVKLFKDDGTNINTDLNAEEAVAQGTAIYAARNFGDPTTKDLVVEDVASHTITVEYRSTTGSAYEKQMVLKANGKIPFETFVHFDKEAKEARVYENNNDEYAIVIPGPMSVLQVNVYADGIIEAFDPGTKADHDTEMAEHTQGVEKCVNEWKNNNTLLNDLQTLAFSVIRLIETSDKTDKAKKDKKKCEKIKDWASRQMKGKEQSKKIPKKVETHQDTLRDLEKTYSPDGKGRRTASKKKSQKKVVKGKKKVQELEKTNSPDDIRVERQTRKESQKKETKESRKKETKDKKKMQEVEKRYRPDETTRAVGTSL